MRYCPKCGNKMESTWTFCPKCGMQPEQTADLAYDELDNEATTAYGDAETELVKEPKRGLRGIWVIIGIAAGLLAAVAVLYFSGALTGRESRRAVAEVQVIWQAEDGTVLASETLTIEPSGKVTARARVFDGYVLDDESSVTVTADENGKPSRERVTFSYLSRSNRKSDRFTYEINDDGTATITGYSGDTENLFIPQEIDHFSVTAIGRDAFNYKNTLSFVSIPDTVTSIGASAFCGCSSLLSITIPKGVTSIGEYAFSGCSKLTSITIPDSVTSIGDYAFYECRSLTSITIPDSVTSIGKYAFGGCSSLTTITIPDTVTSIGESTFNGCRSLTSITIPDSVTSIGEYAFNGCYKLTSITIPASVTYISVLAFNWDVVSFIVSRGSFAEEYCDTNGCHYTYSE